MATLTTAEEFPSVTVQFLNGAGQPAPVDGVPEWATSDATVLTVTPSADGLSAVVSSVAEGVARITVTADADVGAGVVPITGVSEDVTVTPDPNALASTINFTFGAAQPKA